MKLSDAALRTGIWFLALTELAVGVVATLTPRVFYDHVPGVSLLPPYSEHLMRDVGAMSLALTVVLFVAAITMEQRIVRTALIAYLVFAIPHLLFHVTRHQHYTTAVAITETTGLVVAVLFPIALLILELRGAGTPERPPTAGWSAPPRPR